MDTVIAEPRTMREENGAARSGVAGKMPALPGFACQAVASADWREYDPDAPDCIGSRILRKGTPVILPPGEIQGHGRCIAFTEENWRRFEANGCRFHQVLPEATSAAIARSGLAGVRFCGALARNFGCDAEQADCAADQAAGRRFPLQTAMRNAFVANLRREKALAPKCHFGPDAENAIAAAQTVAVLEAPGKTRIVAIFACPVDERGNAVNAGAGTLRAARAFAGQVAAELGRAKFTYLAVAAANGWAEGTLPAENPALREVLLAPEGESWRIAGDLPLRKGRAEWRLFPETESQMLARLKAAFEAKVADYLWQDVHAAEAVEMLHLPPSALALARRLMNGIVDAEPERWYVDWDKAAGEHCLAHGRRPDFVKPGLRFPQERTGFFAWLMRCFGQAR